MRLHRDVSTQKSFYAQRLLHKDTFAHRSFYTEKSFRQRNLYTEELSHREVFTQRRFYTQMLLHKETFTHRNFYTQKTLHKKTFTRTNLYAEELLQGAGSPGEFFSDLQGIFFQALCSTAEDTTNLQEDAQNLSSRNMLSSQPILGKSPDACARFKVHSGFDYLSFPVRLVFI